MAYYFNKFVDLGFDKAIERTTACLAEAGFGVLTDIDVSATMKKKIGKDMKPYRILGACNPGYAYQALSAEDKIGTMLPCNVIVRETADGRVEVAAVDPVASMQAVDNPGLHGIATAVREALQKVIAAI